MSETIIRDNYFLLYSLIMGVLVTVFYDVLRIFRRVVRHGNLLISIEDLFYWVIVAISVFYLMHKENNGMLRWFAILGAGIGMLVYKRFISSLLVDAVSRLLLFLLKYFGKAFYLLFTPIRFFVRRLKKSMRIIKTKSSKKRARIKKKLTECIKTLKMTLCKQ